MTHDRLVELLRTRYDTQSATAVLERALAGAGLAPARSYDGAALTKIGDQIAAWSTGVDDLVTGLRLEAERAVPAPSPAAPAAAPAREKHEKQKNGKVAPPAVAEKSAS